VLFTPSRLRTRPFAGRCAAATAAASSAATAKSAAGHTTIGRARPSCGVSQSLAEPVPRNAATPPLSHTLRRPVYPLPLAEPVNGKKEKLGAVARGSVVRVINVRL